jgi:uncharacterized protein (DUF1778 family)
LDISTIRIVQEKSLALRLQLESSSYFWRYFAGLSACATSTEDNKIVFEEGSSIKGGVTVSVEAQKSEDFKFRLDSTTSNLLERASGYIGLDKIKFIRESIREKALAIIEEHEKTTFTEDDWRMFFALRENPPEPTEAMKIAAEAYKALIANHAD